MNPELASPSIAERPVPERSRAVGADTLSVRRLLLLATTEAFGFWVVRPEASDPWEIDFWRRMWWLALFGLTLAGPLVVIGLARRGEKIGLAAHVWLMSGLGGWLFVPGMIYGRIVRGDAGALASCLVYTQSLLGLWLVCALLVTDPGHLRRLWTPGPWSERFGLWIAAVSAPHGAWMTVDLYRDVIL